MPTLTEQLKKKGVINSPAIERAFTEVDRADFIPEELQAQSHEDIALPIEGGQTISQPYTVAFMLEQLHVRPGDIVLDIGYGSGWQTALLASLVGPSGKVYAFEIVPQLCAQGRKNLAKYMHLSKRVEFLCMSGKSGYEEVAPFDRIIAAAEVKEVPSAWREQLLPGGRLVYPKKNALMLEIKKVNGSFEVKTFPGFVFVPFVED